MSIFFERQLFRFRANVDEHSEELASFAGCLFCAEIFFEQFFVEGYFVKGFFCSDVFFAKIC